MVGNRSRLFRDHPDWVVRDCATGEPLAQMHFYGEFRWHKRSEEYYILDITHPEAEAYIRQVFRTWARDWGAGYFKTDFMLFGSEHGPDHAVWHQQGLSRIAIWRRMAALIREEIGEALWLGCGCPLWASVGYVDAVRIGRDVGVSWKGEYSAESLLRDQVSRNHAAGILWQGDPDCVLLRSRFHELTDTQVETLARFAGNAGGVLMTSDKLDELTPERAALFADLLRERVVACAYPKLGRLSDLLIQQARLADGTIRTHEINLSPEMKDGLPPFSSRVS
jgi:alpha-galactosidase